MHQHQHQLKGMIERGRVHFVCTVEACGWTSDPWPATQAGVALARLDVAEQRTQREQEQKHG